MLLIHPPIRGQDNHGAGYYGAPRGSRKHKGIDFNCPVGSLVTSLARGKVTKLGYPYADHLEYRYVQIAIGGLNYRYFYIDPMVKVGDIIEPNQVIGSVQDLDLTYPGITPHCHFEVKQGREYLDPTKFAFE